MTHAVHFAAVDLGASNGRFMLGRWNGRTLALEELHRFPNGGVLVGGNLHWNVLGLWSEIQNGLMKYSAGSREKLSGIGVDAWGVDFALLDGRGSLVGNPYHYRDARTDGVPELVFEQVDERALFSETGVQTMQINTLFQLYSMIEAGDPQMETAATLLMIPDLFHYFLCGEKCVEFTEATTTQMYATTGEWARNTLERLQIPVQILPRVVAPGTVLGSIRPEVLRNAGLNGDIPVAATASHDTANAVAAIPNMDEHSAFISSGTWSLMGAELKQPVTSDRAFGLKFTNEGGADGSTLLLKNLTGLWILQECMRQWASEGHGYSWAEVTSMASSAAAFQCVIDVDASDFRTPKNMSEAIAAYCRRTGQSLPLTTGAVARCCLESLSLKYRSVLESLETLTERPLTTVRVVGGGCLNALLCQMTADACNRLVISGPVEASAYGNVMLQAIATGHLPNVKAGRAAMAESVECVSYFPQRTAVLDAAYARLEQMQSVACAAS